jgi:hypothetical protein
MVAAREIEVEPEALVTPDFATPQDDAELRRLLRETPMRGAFTATLEREPSFFFAAETEGDHHCIVVGRIKGSERLMGLGCRSERQAFVNGDVRTLGYLGALRVEPTFRGGKGMLRAGYSLMGQEQAESEAEFCVTTIIEDNRQARKALTSGWPGLPTYREYARIWTLAIPLWRKRRPPTLPGVRFAAGRPEDLPAIAACLQRHYRPLQFAPCISADELNSHTRCRDLRVQDFVVAWLGSKVIGCVAVWDQTRFKQFMVRGYSTGLGLARPLVNVVGPAFGIPRLPRPGRAFQFAYLSHLAAPFEDEALWHALVVHGQNEARRRGLSYVCVGLAEPHPRLLGLRKAFRHMPYRSLLYTVHWQDGEAAVDALEKRVPHVEIATL